MDKKEVYTQNWCYNSHIHELNFFLKILTQKHICLVLAHIHIGLLIPLRNLPMMPLNLGQGHHLVAQGLYIPI